MLKNIINNDIISRQSTRRTATTKNIKTINFVFADVDILCFKLWFIVASMYIATESTKKNPLDFYLNQLFFSTLKSVSMFYFFSSVFHIQLRVELLALPWFAL